MAADARPTEEIRSEPHPAPGSSGGVLYLVATPIGNLEDISRRALRTLAEADLILCEDTRHTGKLLHHFGIKTRTLSYHEHNEEARAAEAAEMLAAGRSLALVSDAGTPAINDPGFRLVRACIERGFAVVPVPGAAAFLSALIASGLPVDEFYFGGFLPSRSGARRARLAELRTARATLIFYEAPHRIVAALGDARDTLGDRRACVARELTKLHESFARGRIGELVERAEGENFERGEIVLLIEGAGDEPAATDDANAPSVAARVAALEAGGLDQRQALKQIARESGVPRAELYRRLVAEKNQGAA